MALDSYPWDFCAVSELVVSNSLKVRHGKHVWILLTARGVQRIENNKNQHPPIDKSSSSSIMVQASGLAMPELVSSLSGHQVGLLAACPASIFRYLAS